jgi:hypothetical protein
LPTNNFGTAPVPEAMNDIEPPLRQFQAIVHGDPALQSELRGAPDQETFVALVMARSRARGLAIDPADIAAELEAAKRTWTVQWLVR